MTYDLRILSLGAGVQSSALALMCERGDLEAPDAAIFADTGAEPQSVYRWLDQLEAMITRYPIYRVSNGNLYDDAFIGKTSKLSGKRYTKSMIPFFIKNPDGSQGMLPRKCTSDYKIAPIKRKVRELLKAKGGKKVQQWIGISTDEASRMKDSPVKYIDHYYPLIERNMSRADCLKYFDDLKLPRPPRSACTFCPYHSDAEWSRLAKDEREDFDKAVQWEKALQERIKEWDEVIKGTPFVHPSLVPLDQALFDDRNQLSLFDEECEGMCGL